MPSLIEAVKSQITAAHKSRFAARGQKLREMSGKFLDAARQDVAWQWEARPMSTGRMVMELWLGSRQQPRPLPMERAMPR